MILSEVRKVGIGTYTPFFLFDGSYSIKGFLTVVNLVWEFTLTVETQDF